MNLHDVRDPRLSKQHNNHVKAMHSFLYMTAEFTRKRAEIEMTHQKALNDLLEKYSKQTELVQKEVHLPTVLSAWELVLLELRNEMQGSNTLSKRLTEEVSKPLQAYHDKIKLQSKRMWKEREDEEIALKKMDEETNQLMKESSESYKIATADPNASKIPFKKNIMKSSSEVEKERLRQTVHSKVSHNKYLLHNEEGNAHRKQFWLHESSEMMDTMQSILYTKFSKSIQSYFTKYVDVLRQYVQNLPKNVEDIMGCSKDDDNTFVGVNYIEAEQDLNTVIEKFKESGHVPFKLPEKKQFESQNSYGTGLLVDEHTLYSLAYTRNVLLQKKEENETKLRQKEEEVVALSQVDLSSAGVSGEQEAQENELNWQKELRNLRLEQAKFIKLLQIYDCAGINSGHAHTHTFSKTTLMISQNCYFCGASAGGLHISSAGPASCKLCKIVCHEGYCAGSVWKGCKGGDKPEGMLVNIVSTEYQDDYYDGQSLGATSIAASTRNSYHHTVPEPQTTKGDEEVPVLFDYEAQSEAEISAVEGDIAIVHEKEQEEWYRCTINGLTGMFPASYLDYGDYYDDFEEGYEDEVSAASGHASAVASVANSTASSANNTRPSSVAQPSATPLNNEIYNATNCESEYDDLPAAGKSVIAIYDYEAKNEDELSFREGDELIALGEDDEGWTEGVDKLGNKGVFPSNYCE